MPARCAAVRKRSAWMHFIRRTEKPKINQYLPCHISPDINKRHSLSQDSLWIESMVMRGKFWSKLLRMPKNCLLQIVSRKSLSTNLLSNHMQTPLIQVATRKSSVMCYTIVTSVWVVVITIVSTMHVMNNGAGNTVFDKMMLVTTKEGLKLSCYR